MYALEHHIDVWFLGAVVFENAIALIGPHDLSGIRFPPEAACLTQLWGVCKIGFAAPDSFFHHFTFGDIRYRADDLVVAGLVPKAMCKMMKMLYRTIRHQQAMLPVKASSALRCTFEELCETGHIVRMRSLQYQVECWFRPGSVSVDPGRFLRPEHPLRTNFYSDTTGPIESLRIS